MGMEEMRPKSLEQLLVVRAPGVSEIIYLVIFAIILIAAVGDGLTDRVGAYHVVAYVLAPIGIAIIAIRSIRSR
ncbi:hypothetical protein GOACH_26_00550 [Gordonia aichiensis NBRC 108223]|uniref:Uncharacterized protein n=1 Tax=Gordonia aichiensis NBRC 108223 TaxID=1220583 RepID=L7KSA7_9ACTN|nr:hypothetical protein GOACH_26_00550 [Gordonia aichiensis NBRC 108223]